MLRIAPSALDALVVRQVAVEERAEVDERLREAGSAAAVEHEVRGVTVSVRRSARRAVHGLRLAPLAVRPHVHEEADEPKVVVDRVARRKQGRPRGELGGRIVSVQRGPKAERELALVAPVSCVAVLLPE